MSIRAKAEELTASDIIEATAMIAKGKRVRVAIISRQVYGKDADAGIICSDESMKEYYNSFWKKWFPLTSMKEGKEYEHFEIGLSLVR